MTDPNEYGVFAEQIKMLESWTAEEAHQVGDKWWEDMEGNKYAACAPVFQWTAWNESLPSLQEAYESSADPKVLFKAMEFCLNRGLPVPRWCAQAFVNSWRKVERYEVRTLDEAFGKIHKNIKLHDAKRKRLLADKVTIDTLFRIQDGDSTENALRAIAAEEGISYELAREWYYERRNGFSFLQSSEKS